MFTLSCKDLGNAECPFVAEGTTKEEAVQKMSAHASEVHAMADAVGTPEMQEKMLSAVHEA